MGNILGTWGTSIYSSDIAQDVKGDYYDAISVGMTDEEAFFYVCSYVPDEGDEDECNFWCGLSLAQWKIGRLIDKVKEKTISIIDNGGDIWLWEESEAKLSEINKRISVLKEVKETIQSPITSVKNIKPRFCFKSPWAIGDVVAYKLNSDNFADTVFKYILLHVVGIEQNVCKIPQLSTEQLHIRIFDYEFSELPTTISKIKKNKYIQLVGKEPIKKYIKNSYFKVTSDEIDIFKYVRWIWCMSKIEYNNFMIRTEVIGNIPIKKQQISKSVSVNYQFSKFDTTIQELFND